MVASWLWENMLLSTMHRSEEGLSLVHFFWAGGRRGFQINLFSFLPTFLAPGSQKSLALDTWEGVSSPHLPLILPALPAVLLPQIPDYGQGV